MKAQRASRFLLCFVLIQFIGINISFARDKKKIVPISYVKPPIRVNTQARQIYRGPGSAKVKPNVVKVHYSQRNTDDVAIEPLDKKDVKSNVGIPVTKKKKTQKKNKITAVAQVPLKKLTAAEEEKLRLEELKKLRESSEKDLLADYEDL